MQLTTLCYIESKGCYLMLHRIKKQQDINAGKWIGVGGHFFDDESPEECLLREVREETGLTLTSYACRGIITFVNDQCETEYMHLFTADGFTGELTECDEGILAWQPIDRLEQLNLWEGDRIFLKLLQERKDFFLLKLVYHGDCLVQAILNGQTL